MNPWSGPTRWCGPLGRASALALAFLLPCAALAQEADAAAPKGLAAWSGPLLISFLVLLGIFLALLAWEFLDRRSGGQEEEHAAGGMSPYQPPTGPAPAVDDEDPFQALLKKSSPPREEPMATPFRSDSLSDVPAAPATGYVPPTTYSAGPAPAPPAPPARPARDEEEEELSPFQRLAQIGSEDRDTFAPPAPPAPPPRPARIELSSTPAPAPAPASPKPEAAGGDWASLLSKVQSDEPAAPAPPAAPPKPPSPPPAPPKAAVEEEDPWKKLLGQASAGEAPQAPAPRPVPATEGEADPWQALLRKTSAEAPAAPATPPAPPAPQAPPRIKLGTDQEPAPGAEPPAEPGRPRAISLDFKREAGRSIPPPPQTEDEESR